MKQIKQILIGIAWVSAVSLSSCSGFLDITPTDVYTEETVFSDPVLAQAFVDNLYNTIQHGAKEHTTDGLTDDAFFTHNYGQKDVNQATVSGGDTKWYGDGNCPFKWVDRFKGVRYCNIILKNIDKVPTSEDHLKKMKGEACFVRAWLYTELVRGFGGVPVTKEVFDMNDIEGLRIPRNNMDECLAFIVKDCDDAAANLPEKVDAKELGRATKYAAIALKARILLQIASPLYADRVVNTLACNQFGGDRMELYRQAKAAAEQVINDSPYQLLDCKGGSNTERATKWNKIITTNNEEQIFTRQFGTGGIGEENWLAKQHGPNGYHCWSGSTPTQDLVMAFEFEDGTFSKGMTQIGDHQIGNPYNGREPRFYATVGTDGNEWGRERPDDAKGLDPTPLGRLQAGFYEVTDGNTDIELQLPTTPKTSISFKGMCGIDTQKGPIEAWNGSWTGYYERKLIDPTVDAQNHPQPVPWTFLRLAEMYLVAAEASVELNELDDAVTYLDALRKRIGILGTKAALTAQGKTFNQEDLREFVRHERRVELAFEGSRYFDVRRWMIAPVTNNKPLAGILVYGLLKPGQTQKKPYIHNETKYEYHYWVQAVNMEDRKWADKMYFAPIHRDEIKRSGDVLVQNPGMED